MNEMNFFYLEIKCSEEYFTLLLVYLSRWTITKLQMFSVTNDHFMLCGEHFWTHLTSHLNPSSCKVQIPLFLQVLIGSYTPSSRSSRSPPSVEPWFLMEFSVMLVADWTTLFSITNDLVQPPSLVLPYIILFKLNFGISILTVIIWHVQKRFITVASFNPWSQRRLRSYKWVIWIPGSNAER